LTGSQTFHNNFLKGLETAPAFTKPDANMKKETRLTSAVLVAATTFMLNGCGADDAASASASASSTTASSGHDAEQSAVAANIAIGSPAAPSRLPANPAAASDPAFAFNPASNPASNPDPIAQTMQASLAADSQQIAPVMHYAPGDNSSGSDTRN
jgi:hypothetical protein